MFSDNLETISNKNVETLIDLKFAVERQISVLEETFSKAQKMQLSNPSEELDAHRLIGLYNSNIKMSGTVFLEQQTELLKLIHQLLIKKCEHNWINDAIDSPCGERFICYCSKCHIYK